MQRAENKPVQRCRSKGSLFKIIFLFVPFASQEPVPFLYSSVQYLLYCDAKQLVLTFRRALPKDRLVGAVQKRKP